MTAAEVLKEIHDVAARRIDRDVCALACLTKIEELARHVGELGAAIYRASRATPDATKAMRDIAALCAQARETEAA